MTHFFESEQLTLKRLYIAIRNNDHDLFEKGVTKIQLMLEQGVNFTLLKEWGKLHYQVHQMNLDRDVYNRFQIAIKQIITCSHNKRIQEVQREVQSVLPESCTIPSPVHKKDSHPAVEPEVVLNNLFSKPISLDFHKEPKRETKKCVILFSGEIHSDVKSLIKEYRRSLDDLQDNKLNSNNQEWLRSLSSLYMISNRQYQELETFHEFLSQEDISGDIIIANYGLAMYQCLNKADVNYTIANIHQEADLHAKWHVIPLGGSFNIFKCLKCGSQSLETNLRDKVLVSLCSSCYLPIYPDLYDIYSEDIKVKPSIWYQAAESLRAADHIYFIMPPLPYQQTEVFKLLTYVLNKKKNSRENFTLLPLKTHHNMEWWEKQLNIR